MKKSLSSSSIEENLEALSLLLLLLWRRLQEERLSGERSKEIVPLLPGISIGAVSILLLDLSTSSTALFTAMALLVKSSKSLMLLCFWRLVGVCKAVVDPPLTIQGWSRTWSASNLVKESLTRSWRIRSFASNDTLSQCCMGKITSPSLMLAKSISWHSMQDSPLFALNQNYFLG